MQFHFHWKPCFNVVWEQVCPHSIHHQLQFDVFSWIVIIKIIVLNLDPCRAIWTEFTVSPGTSTSGTGSLAVAMAASAGKWWPRAASYGVAAASRGLIRGHGGLCGDVVSSRSLL